MASFCQKVTMISTKIRKRLQRTAVKHLDRYQKSEAEWAQLFVCELPQELLFEVRDYARRRLKSPETRAFDLEWGVAYLDGQAHPGLSPMQSVMLAVLFDSFVKDRTNFVKRRTIRNRFLEMFPERRPRSKESKLPHDRTIARAKANLGKLSPALEAIIVSENGSGGGYRLDLAIPDEIL